MRGLGWGGFCLLGAFGVMFHETSHLIAALIFRHKITDIALFRPVSGKEDGVLGYVHHSYSRASRWQCVGNFFIGTAPMVFGAGFLTALLYISSSMAFNMTRLAANCDSEIFGNSIKTVVIVFSELLQMFIGNFAIFSQSYEFNAFTAIFVIFAFLICPHLGMSGADFKNTISGTLFLVASSFVAPAVINAWLEISYSDIYTAMLVFVTYYTFVLLIGFFVSLMAMLVNMALSSCLRPKKKTKGA